MITMDKKYRCRDGVPVTVLAVGLNALGSVVAVRHTTNSGDVIIMLEADGRWTGTDDNPIDLIEISPYDDYKVDDPVMVSHDGELWFRRHFAGVDKDGNPTAFDRGATSWSKPEYAPTRWEYCRRPTPEELGE